MSATKLPSDSQSLLSYLQHKMPGYSYDAKIDPDFVAELMDDFAGEIDVLEEAKSFRWYYGNEPAARLRSVRLGLRRWIANARNRRAR